MAKTTYIRKQVKVIESMWEGMVSNKKKYIVVKSVVEKREKNEWEGDVEK